MAIQASRASTLVLRRASWWCSGPPCGSQRLSAVLAQRGTSAWHVTEQVTIRCLRSQPNYLRVWAGLFTLVIYMRPAAIVGVVAAVGVTYLNLGLSTGSYQLDPEVCHWPLTCCSGGVV